MGYDCLLRVLEFNEVCGDGFEVNDSATDVGTEVLFGNVLVELASVVSGELGDCVIGHRENDGSKRVRRDDSRLAPPS